jgi:hypothetical protein
MPRVKPQARGAEALKNPTKAEQAALEDTVFPIRRSFPIASCYRRGLQTVRDFFGFECQCMWDWPTEDEQTWWFKTQGALEHFMFWCETHPHDEVEFSIWGVPVPEIVQQVITARNLRVRPPNEEARPMPELAEGALMRRHGVPEFLQHATTGRTMRIRLPNDFVITPRNTLGS